MLPRNFFSQLPRHRGHMPPANEAGEWICGGACGLNGRPSPKFGCGWFHFPHIWSPPPPFFFPRMEKLSHNTKSGASPTPARVKRQTGTAGAMNHCCGHPKWSKQYRGYNDSLPRGGTIPHSPSVRRWGGNCAAAVMRTNTPEMHIPGTRVLPPSGARVGVRCGRRLALARSWQAAGPLRRRLVFFFWPVVEINLGLIGRAGSG